MPTGRVPIRLSAEFIESLVCCSTARPTPGSNASGNRTRRSRSRTLNTSLSPSCSSHSISLRVLSTSLTPCVADLVRGPAGNAPRVAERSLYALHPSCRSIWTRSISHQSTSIRELFFQLLPRWTSVISPLPHLNLTPLVAPAILIGTTGIAMSAHHQTFQSQSTHRRPPRFPSI
jgi:hypothetical protein